MRIDSQQIKCIVCDLDGTLLLPDATLGERTIAAVKACRERGVQFMLATGRSVMAAESYRAALELSGAMIYYNGAELVDMPESVIISGVFLPLEVALFCVELARERKTHFHLFFCDDKDASIEILMSENPSNAALVYGERTGLNFQYGDLLHELNRPNPPICAKGLFIGEGNELEELRAILHKRFPAMLNIVKSAETFLEILHKDASKGNALKKALVCRGVAEHEVIAFGDEENDISMLHYAGFSAAPANAKAAVKAAAKMVIGANSEEAVAAFLEENIL